jgi:hypothetical protein
MIEQERNLIRSRPAKDCSIASKNSIEIFADILGKKPQNDIPVLLQQPTFSAIATVGLGARSRPRFRFSS